jgi:mono/diheme cytochrome c family protein
MSDESHSADSSSTNAEPTAIRSTVPMWIIVFTLILLFIGGVYFDRHSGWFNPKIYGSFNSLEQLEAYQPKSGADAARAHGKVVYEAVCGICHGPDGKGKPGQAPALAGSEWVLAKGINRLAHIPLLGVSGTIKVEGQDWNLNMAAMGAALPDEDLAGVLTYIRSSWGNQAGAVNADDIKKIRADLGKGAQPMSGEQMMAMPE